MAHDHHPPHLNDRLGAMFLPAPLVDADLPLLGRALSTVDRTERLDYPRKQVLVGVLPHCRCPRIVETIVNLNGRQLSTLADALYGGLLLARNLGGRKTQGAATPCDGSMYGKATDTAGDAFGDLVAALDLADVVVALEPDGVVDGEGRPNRRTASGRRASHRADCLARQLDRCPITHAEGDLGVEACHILPDALVARTSFANCLYWFTLAVILGPQQQRQIWDIAGGAKSWESSNGIALGGGLDTLFDRGLFVLLPDPDSPALQAANAGHGDASSHRGQLLDVKMLWRTEKNTSAFVTMFSSNPDDQLRMSQRRRSADGSTALAYDYNILLLPRCIGDSERFRLFTNDPERYPLPSPVLLELHALVWSLIGAVGLRETNEQKATRIGTRRKNGGFGACDGDDSDDQDDDDQSDEAIDPDGGAFGQYSGWRYRIDRMVASSKWLRDTWEGRNQATAVSDGRA